MRIVKEVEQAIAKLPIHEATMLRFWLNEYQAAYRYKKLKAYAMAAKTLAEFEKSNGSSSWN